MILQDDVKTSLVTATGLSAAIACVIMGIGANLPISLAPGMGLNAYFAFNVVGAFGTGNVGIIENVISWCLNKYR